MKLSNPKTSLVAVLALSLVACRQNTATVEASSAPSLNGMGTIHHPIATRSEAAQKMFDQGLALVYGFNFGEAIRSFHRAAELDPQSPMPYWGIALALGPNYNQWTLEADRESQGLQALQNAKSRIEHGSSQERAYIAALELTFSSQADVDQETLREQYAEAMRQVFRENPSDSDAAALFAASLMNVHPWHLWNHSGETPPATAELVSVLSDGLKRWPNHIGLNHFYIHAMEASATPGEAMPSAMRLPTLAPAAPHLVHMPSHIFYRCGDYVAAVQANHAAIAADERYQQSMAVPPDGVMGYAHHNYHFLSAAASMDGEFQVAYDAAAMLGQHSNSEAYMVAPLLVLARFARWDDLLNVEEPSPEATGVRFYWRFARASARIHRKQWSDAEQERAGMEREYAKLGAGPALEGGVNDWKSLHQIAQHVLEARLVQAHGSYDRAVDAWRKAIREEDDLNIGDLPDWYYPVRESLGALYLNNHDWARAEETFRDDLKRNPSNPRSLFGLVMALEHQHKAEAEVAKQNFARQWRGPQPPRIEDL